MTEPMDALASDYSIPLPDITKPLITYLGLCDLGCSHEAEWSMYPGATPVDHQFNALPKYEWRCWCPRCDGGCIEACCTGWTFKAQLRRRLAA